MRSRSVSLGNYSKEQTTLCVADCGFFYENVYDKKMIRLSEFSATLRTGVYLGWFMRIY